MIFHRIMQLIRHVARRFLEFLDARAQTFGEFRQLFRSEKNQHQRENQNNLAATEVKQGKHDIHITGNRRHK